MEFNLDQMIYYSSKCIFLLTDQPFNILPCFLGFLLSFSGFFGSSDFSLSKTIDSKMLCPRILCTLWMQKEEFD